MGNEHPDIKQAGGSSTNNRSPAQSVNSNRAARYEVHDQNSERAAIASSLNRNSV